MSEYIKWLNTLDCYGMIGHVEVVQQECARYIKAKIIPVSHTCHISTYFHSLQLLDQVQFHEVLVRIIDNHPLQLLQQHLSCWPELWIVIQALLHQLHQRVSLS